MPAEDHGFTQFTSLAPPPPPPPPASIGLAAQRVDEEVTIDQCNAVGDPAQQTSDVLVPLMYGSYLAGWHVSEGLETDVARCAAFAQAKTMPLVYDEYPLWDDVVALSAFFVADCS